MSLLPAPLLRLQQAIRPAFDRLVAKGLGILIAWQLLFIPLANYLEFFPHRPAGQGELLDFRELAPGSPPANPAIHAISHVTDAWAQATGQYQAWWLFAPEFPPAATFPVVKLTHSNSTSNSPPIHGIQSSRFEPPPTGNYVRLPSGADRLFLYEMHLGIGLTWWDPTTPSTTAEETASWQRHFKALITRQRQSLVRYTLWQEQQYLKSHPELSTSADELILGMNRYPSATPQPDQAQLPNPEFIPMLRLQRSRNRMGQLCITSLEGYDPIRREYWPIDLSTVPCTSSAPSAP